MVPDGQVRRKLGRTPADQEGYRDRRRAARPRAHLGLHKGAPRCRLRAPGGARLRTGRAPEGWGGVVRAADAIMEPTEVAEVPIQPCHVQADALDSALARVAGGRARGHGEDTGHAPGWRGWPRARRRPGHLHARMAHGRPQASLRAPTTAGRLAVSTGFFKHGAMRLGEASQRNFVSCLGDGSPEPGANASGSEHLPVSIIIRHATPASEP
mmetsp:Transcript_129501/g.314559  ORF Transcript_129501/g.314559 Transcript_129501/m.314559 type:complete len:212 (+) Transcript_129501:802-1437(+)